jgi:acetyl esterase/lipase
MPPENDQHDQHVPARTIAAPAFLSDIARGYLKPQPAPVYPPLDDQQAWLDYVAAQDNAVLPMLRQITGAAKAVVEERTTGAARVYDILPDGVDPQARGVILDMHGGGLILCGGELCKLMATGAAASRQCRTWAVDYRMPPAFPYPAGLDDCMDAYRALLLERSPAEIIVSGGSAGGNLAAALILRLRDEGLPLPAGVILGTPEVDLTESGDSFQLNEGVDPGLHSLMTVNLLYANGHDLRDPYLSPLFGDLAGFPPTILTTGTRDLFLSNTVRMHRALRAAKVPAQLHLTEAGPHTGFPGAPEGEQIDREIRGFIQEIFRTPRA